MTWIGMKGYSEMDFFAIGYLHEELSLLLCRRYVTVDDLHLESSTIHHQPHPKIVVVAWQTGLGPIES